MKTYKLNAGGDIPALGFGTWQITGEECTTAVSKALEIGYRHIDTAAAYGNHIDVGRAIKASSIKREEIFLTSKVFRGDLYQTAVMEIFKMSCEDLQTDYLDLFLAHWPNHGIPMKETLGALVELKQQGKIRAYGVSNYTAHHLQDALDLGFEIANNQVEFHPSLNQNELKAFCDEKNILMTAYSPIAQGQDLQIPQIKELAKKYGKTPSQIILNWLISKNMVAIPRSATPERIKENFESLDFEMSPQDYQIVEGLGSGNRIVDPEFGEFDY